MLRRKREKEVHNKATQHERLEQGRKCKSTLRLLKKMCVNRKHKQRKLRMNASDFGYKDNFKFKPVGNHV